MVLHSQVSADTYFSSTTNTEQKYEYQIFSGLSIGYGLKQLREINNEPIQVSHFYLLRDDNIVFKLHPWVVFFKVPDQSGVTGSNENSEDMALYDHMANLGAEFLSFVMRKMMLLDDQTVIAQLRELIYYNLRVLKFQERFKKTEINWKIIRDAGYNITQREMANARRKYQKQFYLKRISLLQKFSEFLESNQTAFVLTGKSGVGKSNFVISLMDIYGDDSRYAFLMYDAGRIGSERVLELIYSDLSTEIGMSKADAGDIFKRLDEKGQMSNNKMLLVFDALNESGDGKRLMQQIDHLISRNHYPWLKIVLTSRPYAWKILSSGAYFARDQYFTEQNLGVSDNILAENVGVGMVLQEFDRVELPEAFEHYRNRYSLKNTFTDLLPKTQDLLRDPLLLNLLAETYQGQEIPKHLDEFNIFPNYISALLHSARLQEKDLVLLKEDIVPLMVVNTTLRNRIGYMTLLNARTTSGQSLWEMVRNEDPLSNGESVNNCFQRLKDTGILIEEGVLDTYFVRFKYERLYNFFIGEKIKKLADAADDKTNEYKRWILSISDHPFIWGAVLHALRLELLSANYQLIIQLCFQEQSLFKETIVHLLGQISRENPAVVALIVNELSVSMDIGNKKGVFAQLFTKESKPAPKVLNAVLTAIESSGNIANIVVLEKALTNYNTEIRNAGIFQCINLWEREKRKEIENINLNKGFQVLTGLVANIRQGTLIPNFKAIESSIKILLYLGTSNFDSFRKNEQKELESQILKLSKEIIEQILYLNPSNRLLDFAKGIIRDRAITFMINWVIKLLNDSPDKASLNPAVIESFLKRPLKEKEVISLLTHYLDPTNLDIEKIEDKLENIISLNEGIVDFALNFVFFVQWKENEAKIIQILDKIVGFGQNKDFFTIYLFYSSSLLMVCDSSRALDT